MPKIINPYYRGTVAGGDPYFNYVTLLLHMDGSDASTTFTDDSNLAHSVTANGNAQIDTAQSKFGGASAFFDGTGDYLTMASGTEDDFTFGTGDFTIEFWLRLDALAGGTTPKFIDFRPLSTTGDYPVIYLETSNAISYNANGDRITSSTTLSTGTWYHIALSRSNGTSRLFIDGTSEGSYADSIDLSCASTRPVIGSGYDLAAGSSMDGWIDDLRITKGIGRYVTNFTPHATVHPDSLDEDSDPFWNYNSLLLHMDGSDTSTTFTDDSVIGNTVTATGDAQVDTAQSKFGGASGLFDGTGDYLAITDSTSLDFGSSDLTFECWFRINSFSAVNAIASIGCNTSNYYGSFILQVRNSTTIRYAASTDGTSWGMLQDATVSTMSTGTWYHLAMIRSGTSFMCFLDGVQIGTTQTLSGSLYGSTTHRIGSYVNPSFLYPLNGWLDEIRITNGVCRYPVNFTPPTQAFAETT